MGSTYSVIIGAAIKCHVPKEYKRDGYSRCSNKDCDNHERYNMDSPFCPFCGGKKEMYSKMCSMSHYDIGHEIGVDDDEFMVLYYDEHYLDKDTEFWFDNRSSETNWVLSHDSSESYEMDDKSVSAVVLRFKMEYKNEIENLKKFYEDVSVGYYVLGYHM